MSYGIEIRLASKNGWHTPAEARAFYKRYSRDGVTIHWWNSPDKVKDSDHDNITNYILGKASRGVGSVNYVVSNTKITLVVNPDNVAWASQGGNPTTVSIECSPHLNAEGYKKLGWVINELFNPKNGRYRKSPGYWRHSDWYQTACPGTISMDKIKQSVGRWEDGKYEDTPPPAPKPPAPSKPINQDWKLWKDGGTYQFVQDAYLYDLTNAKTWGTVKKVKAYKKGDLVDIAGSFHNNYLDRDYYITKYSFDEKNATGFNPVDIEPYNPPTPKPPVPPDPVDPEDPVEPTDPDPVPENPDDYVKKSVVVAFLQNIVKLITDFIEKLKPNK